MWITIEQTIPFLGLQFRGTVRLDEEEYPSALQRIFTRRGSIFLFSKDSF